MAELNLSELRAGIVSKFRAGVRDQVSRSSVLMERFYYGRGEKARGAERYRGGSEMYKMLQYAHKPSARTDGRLSVVVPVAFEAEKIMKVSYGTRVGDVMLYDSDKSANKTGEKIFELMSTRLEQTSKGMKTDVARDLWAGDRSNPTAPDYNAMAFDSLSVIVAESNNYGGISRANDAWFAGKVATYTGEASATDFSLAKIDAMNDLLVDGLEVIPTVQITHSLLWREAAAQLGKLSEFIQQDAKLQERGVQHIMLNCSPVVKDINCPIGQWYHINEDVTQLFIDPDFDFKIGEWESVTAQNPLGAIGNSVHAKALYIKAMMALWCEEPRLNGKHIGFTVPV